LIATISFRLYAVECNVCGSPAGKEAPNRGVALRNALDFGSALYVREHHGSMQHMVVCPRCSTRMPRERLLPKGWERVKREDGDAGAE
jgi:hypothetical protein